MAQYHTVKWVDGNGFTLMVQQYSHNATPVYQGEPPTKASTQEYNYVFNNTWSPSLSTITSDVTYTAQFTSVRRMYLEINGVNISKYIQTKGLKWTRNDIDSAKAGRNLAGTMNRGRVCMKVKLEVKLVPMKQYVATPKPVGELDVADILKLINPEYVRVHYSDPLLGERNVQFYSNNVPATFCVEDSDGNLLWNDISFPLVER